MNFDDRIDELCEEMKRFNQDQRDAIHMFLFELFQLLFWRGYGGGHVDYETLCELSNLFDRWGWREYPDGDSYYTWKTYKDKDDAVALITKVRDMIGLTEPIP